MVALTKGETSSLVLRSRLFLSSYAPLFAMLAVRFQVPVLSYICGAIAILGLATLYLILRSMRGVEADPHQLLSVRDHGGEVAGYVATYLLPFLTVAEPTPRDLVAYLMFLGVVGVIYVRSHMTQVNPLVYLLGLRISEVVTDDGWHGFLISRGLPAADATVLASRLQQGVALQREEAGRWPTSLPKPSTSS